MNTTEDQTPIYPTPTPARPLLALTVLAVEDSRYASEALRLMCIRSVARIRRAECLRTARRHLAMYQPDVVIIDLGLPDGLGTDLIAELAGAALRPDVILATSGDPGAEHRAIMAGADGFLPKPIPSLGQFQDCILCHLPAERRPFATPPDPVDCPEPDRIAYRDDMSHAAEILEEMTDTYALDYVAQFLGGVARIAGDEMLATAAKALAQKRGSGRSAMSEAAIIAGLLQERLSERVAI